MGVTGAMRLLRESQRRAAWAAEIQLTDAIARLMALEPVYAFAYEGKR